MRKASERPIIETVTVMKFWINGILAALVISAFAQEQNLTPDNIETTLLSSIRKELACDCGCGMTVQDCLGGMICSESRSYSNEVIDHLKAGKSREQVLQAMVAKYGEKILSAPPKEGFNLTAWTFPFIALLIGGMIVWRVVVRWKAQSTAPVIAASAGSAAGTDLYDRRFDEEFKQFSG